MSFNDRLDDTFNRIARADAQHFCQAAAGADSVSLAVYPTGLAGLFCQTLETEFNWRTNTDSALVNHDVAERDCVGAFCYRTVRTVKVCSSGAIITTARDQVYFTDSEGVSVPDFYSHIPEFFAAMAMYVNRQTVKAQYRKVYSDLRASNGCANYPSRDSASRKAWQSFEFANGWQHADPLARQIGIYASARQSKHTARWLAACRRDLLVKRLVYASSDYAVSTMATRASKLKSK